MANRFYVGGGNGNWNSTTNWSATDGGASGASFPVAADAVFFTALSGSGNLTVNVASACAALDFTGFTGSIAMNASLTPAGNVTLSPTMSMSGGSSLLNFTASTYTANGFAWTSPLVFQGSGITFTFNDAWTCSNLTVGTGVSAATTTLNGSTITVSGSFTNGYTASGIVAGTTEVIMAGTGNLAAGATAAVTRLPITINTAGTITLPAASYRYNTGTFKYIAGTVVVTSNSFICSASTTFNVPGMAFQSLTLDGTTATYTLQSDVRVNGTLNVGSTTTLVTVNGAFDIITAGAVNFTNTTGNISGTATIKFTGTQTVTKTAGSGSVLCHLLVDSSGTVTFVGDLRVQLNFMQCISGSIVTPDGAWSEFGSSVEPAYTFVG